MTDPLQEALHGMWASAAPAWRRHADLVDERGAVVTEAMLAAGVRPGERVLELACGPGGTGLAAAELVGPGGEVVLS
ncbi:MAG TPA: methyltransferase type 11, partial [Mycobacterium sp.]